MSLKRVLVCLLLTMYATSAKLPCKCILNPLGNGLSADCSNWDFKDIPSCIPNETTILDLSGSIVRELNTSLTSHVPALQQLFFARSGLTVVSVNAFSLTPELRRVDLSHNSLHQLVAGLFDATPLLEEVDLSGNMLRALPGGLFKNVPRLRKLDLSTNYLSSLPGDLLGGCGEQAILRVGQNHLTTLPASLITSCSSMVQLDIRSNGMTVLQDDVVAAIGQLSRINDFGLDGNPWQCDCALSPLVELLRKHDILAETCAAPPGAKGLHVVHVVSELDCAPLNTTTPPAVHASHRGQPSGGRSPSTTTIVVVALVATCCTIAAVAAFCAVRHRRRRAADKFSLIVTENA